MSAEIIGAALRETALLSIVLRSKILSIHSAGHSVRTGNAAVIVELELIGDVELPVIVDPGFSTDCGTADQQAAADEVDVSVRIHTVALAADNNFTTGHVDCVVQFSLVKSVAVGCVDGVISGIDVDIPAEDVDNCTFKTFIAVVHSDSRTVTVFITDGQNMIGMDGVVCRVDGEIPAE